MTGVFISHSHPDKAFVRRLGADLAACGVRPWIDEAELKIGDSLLTKISHAIEEMDFMAVILSPRSVSSQWVQQELEQAMAGQLAKRQVKVLPVLLEKCEIPPFLRGKLYADFTDVLSYDESFAKLLLALGVDASNVTGASLYDPFSRTHGRQGFLAARPQTWHCIFCGWKCNESYNDYICKTCQRIRPFAGGSATMVGCRKCKQFSLGIATFCEWCGSRIANDA